MKPSSRLDWIVARPALIGIAAALLALALVAYALWQKKRAKAASLAGARPARLRRNRLHGVEKIFSRALPREARRRIESFQPFIVLGAAGSGKSTLITSCTDWEGQARQFHPSYTADPLLQIYVGARVIVQELSSSILQDTSLAARRALRRLWAPLSRASVPPRAVVTLDVKSLETAAPEALREQGQLVRGKLNILSEVLGRGAEVSVALTHMESVEGYREFVEFVRRNNLPLKIPLRAAHSDSPRPLAPLEAHLGRALASGRPGEFLKVVAFFRDTSPLFSQLSRFLGAVCRTDPLSREPELASLCFASQSSAGNLITHPFPLRAAPEGQGGHPGRKHLAAAATLVVAGLVLALCGYLHDGSVRREALAHLDEMAMAGTPAAANRAAGQFFRFLKEERERSFTQLVPRFAQGDREFLQASVRREFVETLRDGLFVREMRRLEDIPPEQERLVYYLALTYAGPHNELGQLVRQHAKEWERVVDLPWPLLAKYIDSNTRAEEFSLPDELAHVGEGLSLDDHPADPSAWVPFFHELSSVTSTATVTPGRLASLQARASSILQALGTNDRHALLRETAAALYRANLIPTAVGADPHARDRAELAQESLRNFVLLLRDGGLSFSEAKPHSLRELLDALKLIGNRSQPEETFRFSVGGEEFTFARSALSGLFARARVQALVADFTSARNPEHGLAFFGDERYSDLVLGADGPSALFFPGQAKVDGHFTRRAYDEVVRPVLAEWPAVVKALGLSDAQGGDLSALVVGEADAYARKYVEAYRAYYTSFALAVDSETSLRAVLRELQGPSSPLRNLLATLSDNTALAMGSGPEFAPMALVPSTFAFAKRIVPAADGLAPELDKYLTILALLQRDVETDKPFDAKAGVPGSELRARTTPLGRIGIAVLREEKDSYVDLVERWLAGDDVRPEWQAPFLGPVVAAAQLGLKQVEDTVATAWDDVLRRSLSPMLSSFPFDRRATLEATPAQIEESLSPRGAVARTIADLIEPLCFADSGRLSPRKTPRVSIGLPPGSLELIAEIERIRPYFWDPAGTPRPIALSVKALPLPRWQPGDPVLLAYLQLGGQTILGFNQQVGSRDLLVDWNKPQTASVGFRVELGSGGGARGYNEPESSFSLYRLLSEAVASRDGLYTWSFGEAKPDAPAAALEFQFTSNPWAPFTLAHPGKDEHETASR